MVLSRMFRFLVITLYFLVYLCASGTVSKANRPKTVREVQLQAEQTLKEAKKLFNQAEDILETVESRKLKAQKAASEALATADGKKDIESIAKKIKSAIKEFSKVYYDAEKKAKTTFDTINDLLSKAFEVDKKAKKKVFPATSLTDTPTKTRENALAFASEVDALEKDIETAQLLVTSASDAVSTLSKHAQNIQVAKYQIDAIMTVAEIDIMLSEAEDDIETTELMKEDANKTVEESNDLLNNAPQELLQHLNGFFIIIQAALRRINLLIIKEEEAMKVILEQKQYANDALVTIKNENDEATVRRELLHIDFFASHASTALETIRTSLKMANIYVKTSQLQEQDMLKMLLHYNNSPGSKKYFKPKTPDQPVQHTTTQPEHAETVQPTDNTLEKLVKNKNKNSVIKKNVFLFDVNNDSSTTLSVSLLLVVIAGALIH